MVGYRTPEPLRAAMAAASRARSALHARLAQVREEATAPLNEAMREASSKRSALHAHLAEIRKHHGFNRPR